MIVKGIEGYAAVTQKFVEATMAIDFEDLHRDFLKFIPEKPSLILDVGAGIGRDAWEFSKMGHAVSAIEPTEDYRITGKKMFGSMDIKWIDDSLPNLETLKEPNRFDFILASGVFHHLDEIERHNAIIRISRLLRYKGIFALSIRNGPAGAGTHVFPIDSDEIIKTANSYDLKTLLRIDNQPSLVSVKKNVIWSKLVFQNEK